MIAKQDNPYFGIHYTGTASNRYSATFGPASDDNLIGHYKTLDEAITARKKVLEKRKKEQHG